MSKKIKQRTASRRSSNPREKNPPAENKGSVYSFPTQIRCPRCQAADTRARSTQGDIQYRVCRRAVCRHKFKVVGEKI